MLLLPLAPVSYAINRLNPPYAWKILPWPYYYSIDSSHSHLLNQTFLKQVEHNVSAFVYSLIYYSLMSAPPPTMLAESPPNCQLRHTTTPCSAYATCFSAVQDTQPWSSLLLHFNSFHAFSFLSSLHLSLLLDPQSLIWASLESQW